MHVKGIRIVTLKLALFKKPKLLGCLILSILFFCLQGISPSFAKESIRIIPIVSLTLEGKITNQASQPIALARVNLNDALGHLLSYSSTDTNGNYQINIETYSGYYRIDVSAKDYQPISQLKYLDSRQPNTLDFRLVPDISEPPPPTPLPPSVVSLSPASGTSTYTEWLTFTSVFSHPISINKIRKVYLLVNTSASTANCFYAYYDRPSNKFYLRNDANSAWLGGVSPNSDYIMQNQSPYGQLDCADARATVSGNQLTVIWPIAFKASLSGAKNIYLSAEDDAGLSSGWSQKGTWTIAYRDTTPPKGTLKINNNSQYTNSVNVSLNLTAVDSESAVTQMCFVNYPSGGVSWSEPEPYATTKSWTLTPGGGLKKVYVKFKDSVGNWSIVGGWDAIILDTTAPTTPLVTDDGVTTPSITQLYARWSTTDTGSGITEYQYKITQDSISGPTIVDWVSVATAKEVTKTGLSLIVGKTYYFAVKAKDATGNWSAIGYSDGIRPIEAEKIPPTGTIKINNDSQYATSRSVTLNLTAADNPGGSGIDKVQFSNNNTNWSTPEAYATAKAWTLSSGDGTKTVYVKYSDKAANWSTVYSDTIILDTTPPQGTVTINNNDASTTSSAVNLTLSATDSTSGMGVGSQMQFSSDSTTWLTPEAYATTKSWALSDPKGQKTVYAKFKDAAGNWSAVTNDSINLIDTPPVERIYIYLNGKRVAMEENGKKFFYHTDHLGSTSTVTDEQGQEVKFVEYQPFGATKVETGSQKITKKFTGKELDDSTGLYDYAARQYDAKLGRFISVDPLLWPTQGENVVKFFINPQRLNRYSYTLNNPLRYIDPLGYYEVSVDELKSGDIGLQKVKITSPSILAGPAILINKQKPYAHGVIVLGVYRSNEGKVEDIAVGSIRTRPQIEDLSEGINLNLEAMGDYDFFRVTNNPQESLAAARKAAVLGIAPDKESKITWDPKGLMGALFGRDWTKNNDNRVLCTEYLNLLYGNKFHDPMEGVTTPTHIYDYQEKIKRPN